MKLLLVATFIPFIVVAGCASMQEAPPLPRTQQFNEDDLAPYAGKGNSSIVGEAFLRTRGGNVKKGAGETVWLVPSVAYTSEYVNKEVLPGQKLTPPLDKRVYKYMRTTKADSEGRFRFDQIQPGEYYVYALIMWSIPSVGSGGYVGSRPTGGFAFTTVKANANEQASVVVTY